MKIIVFINLLYEKPELIPSIEMKCQKFTNWVGESGKVIIQIFSGAVEICLGQMAQPPSQ